MDETTNNNLTQLQGEVVEIHSENNSEQVKVLFKPEFLLLTLNTNLELNLGDQVIIQCNLIVKSIQQKI